MINVEFGEVFDEFCVIVNSEVIKGWKYFLIKNLLIFNKLCGFNLF